MPPPNLALQQHGLLHARRGLIPIATTAGSYSDTYTGSASADWSMAMAAFKPATGETGSTTMYMIHTDHLTGSNVLTDASGNVAEVADYYPYGNERVSSGTFDM